MKLIEKYIIKQLLISTLLLILLVISIFALSKSVQLIDLSLNRGLPIIFFFKLILFSLPAIIPIILPIIFCLSILFTYSRMKNDSELIVLESAGTSKIKLIKPVIFFGGILVIISLFFTTYVSPNSNQNFRNLLHSIKNDYSSSLLEEGTFNTIGDSYTIFIKKRSNTGQLENIFIHESKNKNKPTTLIAKNGALIRSNFGTKILLENGSQHFFSKLNNKLSVLYFDKYLFNVGLKDNLNRKANWKSPSERSFYELSNPNLENGDDRNNLQAFKAELTQRFSLPLNILSFGFMIASFMLSQKYLRVENIYFNTQILGLIIIQKLFFILCSNVSIKNSDLELINFLPGLIAIFLGFKVLKDARQIR